jgi:hypothetical protein
MRTTFGSYASYLIDGTPFLALENCFQRCPYQMPLGIFFISGTGCYDGGLTSSKTPFRPRSTTSPGSMSHYSIFQFHGIVSAILFFSPPCAHRELGRTVKKLHRSYLSAVAPRYPPLLGCPISTRASAADGAAPPHAAHEVEKRPACVRSASLWRPRPVSLSSQARLVLGSMPIAISGGVCEADYLPDADQHRSPVRTLALDVPARWYRVSLCLCMYASARLTRIQLTLRK